LMIQHSKWKAREQYNRVLSNPANPHSYPLSTCYKCEAEIDEDDIICCLCIDDTDGRNQHFWDIKNEGIK